MRREIVVSVVHDLCSRAWSISVILRVCFARNPAWSASTAMRVLEEKSAKELSSAILSESRGEFQLRRTWGDVKPPV